MACLPIYKQATWWIITWKSFLDLHSILVVRSDVWLVTTSLSSKPQIKQNLWRLCCPSPKIASRNNNWCHRYWRELLDEVVKGDLWPPVLPHVMSSSAMELHLGGLRSLLVMGVKIQSLCPRSLQNVAVVFVHHAAFLTCLSFVHKTQ